MDIYYPSCNFRTIDSEADDRLRAYALSRGMQVGRCCRTDDHMESEHAFFVCQSCRDQLGSYGKNTESLWIYMAEDEALQLPDYTGLKVNLQDCYRDRGQEEVHEAVRLLLRRMNIEVTEIAKNRNEADFCGRLYCETERYRTEIAQFPEGMHPGHMGDLYPLLMQEHAECYNEEYVVCACNSCFRGIALGGSHPIHLAQLVTNTFHMERQEG